MSASHIVKYHLVIPAAIFGVLALVGVPLATAFFIGMMAGCTSMMLMMAGGGDHEHDDDAGRVVDDRTRR